MLGNSSSVRSISSSVGLAVEVADGELGEVLAEQRDGVGAVDGLFADGPHGARGYGDRMTEADALPRSARRVQAALIELGLPADIHRLADSTRTAPEAAAAVGCELGRDREVARDARRAQRRARARARLGRQPRGRGADRGRARRARRAARRGLRARDHRATRSAASRPSATRARCRRCSTRTCCASRRCGPPPATRTRSSRSPPPCSRRRRRRPCSTLRRMSVALVTGGNRGIGLEVCRQLAAQRPRGDPRLARPGQGRAGGGGDRGARPRAAARRRRRRERGASGAGDSSTLDVLDQQRRDPLRHVGARDRRRPRRGPRGARDEPVRRLAHDAGLPPPPAPQRARPDRQRLQRQRLAQRDGRRDARLLASARPA